MDQNNGHHLAPRICDRDLGNISWLDKDPSTNGSDQLLRMDEHTKQRQGIREQESKYRYLQGYNTIGSPVPPPFQPAAHGDYE